MFNGLNWGPDGWLWGCNGILSNSQRRQAGHARRQARADQLRRLAISSDPRGLRGRRPRHDQPWGLDFDDYGEAFITNCVIPHLFHVVPGAHFQRMFGEDFNPHLYELMETCADHIHWAGGRWQDSRERQGQARRGRRRPCPRRRDDLPGRQLARPLSQQRLHVQHPRPPRQPRPARAPAGSGYVARHEPDFLLANDTWFRGLELKYGPDGGVYLTDWSDIGECHETDADNAHRENGRIYKITYGTSEAGQGRPGRRRRRGAGPAPASQERVVRPHGAAAAPGTRRRGARPAPGPSGAATDPRDRHADADPPAAGALGPARDRRIWTRRPSDGTARRPERARPRLGRPAARATAR